MPEKDLTNAKTKIVNVIINNKDIPRRKVVVGVRKDEISSLVRYDL